MLRTLFCAASALALTGCMGLMETLAGIGNQVCAREVESRLALELARERAQFILDDTKRAVALAGIQASLAVLDRCPEKL